MKLLAQPESLNDCTAYDRSAYGDKRKAHRNWEREHAVAYIISFSFVRARTAHDEGDEHGLKQTVHHLNAPALKTTWPWVGSAASTGCRPWLC